MSWVQKTSEGLSEAAWADTCVDLCHWAIREYLRTLFSHSETQETQSEDHWFFEGSSKKKTKAD